MRGKVLESNGNDPFASNQKSIAIFKNEKCKVTFGLGYIIVVFFVLFFLSENDIFL